MAETPLNIPASETEVTPDWLSAVLANVFPKATFKSIEIERVGEAYGFASRIFRYRWQDHCSPRSIVVKLWQTNSKAGIGEVLFYQTFSEVGTRVPMCFYSAFDEATKKAILVLEDLKDALQGDVLELLDLERAKGVARSLARLHATWLEHPKLADLIWLTDESTWTQENDWVHDRRRLFLERFPDKLDGLARLLLNKIELAPRVANERLTDAPITLLHGDFHLDNLVFEKQVQPVFLDWSRPVTGPLALNLVTLLFFMTPLKNFELVFDCYLGEFDKIAQGLLTRTELEKQLGGGLLRRFALSTCGVARWQPSSSRGVQILEEGIKQISKGVDFWRERDPELFSFLR